jgi:hypothetical protein
VHAGGGLLGDAAPVLDHLRPEARALLGDALEQVLDDLLFVRAGRGVDPVEPFSSSKPLWISSVTSPPSSTTSSGPLVRPGR